jgi:uncharacterized membrane protein required for colicin V production
MRQLFRACAASDRSLALDDEDFRAGLRQHNARAEPIRAGADDHGVVAAPRIVHEALILVAYNRGVASGTLAGTERLLNLLDLVIVLVILASIVAGYRRGFIVGSYDMLVALFSLAIATVAYRPAAFVAGQILDFERPLLNLIGFVLAYMLVGIPGAILLRPMIRRFRSLTGIIPGVHPVDRLLGVLPGAVQGLVIVFVLVLGAGFFSTSTQVGGWLESSQIGLRIYRTGTTEVLDTAGAAGFDPAEFFALTRQASRGGHVLPFKVEQDDLTIEVEEESAMLALVNEERAAAGLGRLDLDPELSAVARAHAIDMYSNGYFSHESPGTGTPFDRLAAAGITFVAAGENLAFAPGVEQAHEGLMASPGHRANILEPRYGRAGIGAVASKLHGTMYVQVFTD